jgi:hypothetical protein
MSQNIHDTNVPLIRKEVYSMIEDVKEIISKGELPSDYTYRLSKKYKHLAKTSKTLFTFIISKCGSNEFSNHKFDENLTMMLHTIEKIQSSSMSQYDASAAVGGKLAKQYIPQLKDKE